MQVEQTVKAQVN